MADVVLVTGAASGIGRRLVGDLVARGHRVCATDLSLETLQRAASEDAWPTGGVLLQALDVRQAAAWESTLDSVAEHWEVPRVVMNVAGVLRPGWIADCTPEDVDLHLDVNLKGVILGTRAAARRMRDLPPGDRGRGHIINIASLASMAPVPGLGLYVASKYGVRGFGGAAAQELRRHGIAVTTVCPDAVKTPMLDLQVDYPEAAITFTAPRFLEPADVSELILTRVLRKRPVLVSIPRSRAFLARVADLFPSAAARLASWLERQGRRRQQELR